MNFRSLWISRSVAAALCLTAGIAVGGDESAPAVPPTSTPATGPAATPAPHSAVPRDASGPDVSNSTEANSAPAAPPATSAPDETPEVKPARQGKSIPASPVSTQESLKSKPVETAKPAEIKATTPKSPTAEKPTIKAAETPKTTSEKPAQPPKAAEKPATPKPVAPVAKPRDPLMDLVDRAILETSRRRLTAGVHTPWQIVHGILAYRWDFKLINPLDAKDISAVEWMFSGQYYDNEPLWLSTPFGGRGHPYTRPYAFEGHPTQFMGYMTMANIPLDYEIQTPERVVKVRDVIHDAKMSVKEGPEVTWTLWAVSHYEEPDAQWVNGAGEPWSIERMVKIQVDEPVTQGACGGTHGLFALAYSRNIYLSTNKSLRGVWAESDQKIKKHIMVSQAYQNADGSLSANYFQGPGYSQDFVKRITTCGHQLEWLMVAMPQSRLKEPWIRNAIQCVAQDLIDNRRTPSDCGPMYHAVNALTIYRQRMLRGQYMIPKRNSPIEISKRPFKNQIIPQQTPVQVARPPEQQYDRHERRRR